jgi:hypothetical protein
VSFISRERSKSSILNTNVLFQPVDGLTLSRITKRCTRIL